MPYGNRRSNDDTGAVNQYGTSPCPRCGKHITLNSFGRKSHISACLKRTVVVAGETCPPVEDCDIESKFLRRKGKVR